MGLFCVLLWGDAVTGKQSVNRVEATALAETLLFTEEVAHRLLRFATDSMYVVRGFQNILAGRWPKTHKDIWKTIRERSEGRNILIVKVESHLDTPEKIQEQIATGAEPFTIVANTLADKAAEIPVQNCQLPEDVVRNLKLDEAVAGAIRNRCAETFLDAVKESPEEAFEPRAKRCRAVPVKTPCEISARRVVVWGGA